MTNLNALMSAHHRTCDEYFAAAEHSADKNDWANCTTLTTQYVEAMEAHFLAEETLLFPAFEQATGVTMGPTRMMRMEHQQMRELLQQMQQAAASADQAGFFGVTETLLILMEQHNMKEENILYPMCDQHLTLNNHPELPGQLADILRSSSLSPT